MACELFPCGSANARCAAWAFRVFVARTADTADRTSPVKIGSVMILWAMLVNHFALPKKSFGRFPGMPTRWSG